MMLLDIVNAHTVGNMQKTKLKPVLLLQLLCKNVLIIQNLS